MRPVKIGNRIVRNYLINEDYIGIFSEEVLEIVLPQEFIVLKKLNKLLNKTFKLIADDEDDDFDKFGFSLNTFGKIDRIYIHNCDLNNKQWKHLFNKLRKIKSLEFLDVTNTNLKKLPITVRDLKKWIKIQLSE